MKESAGELNMTVVTVVIIGVLLLVGITFKNRIGTWVTSLFNPRTSTINIQNP